MGLCNSSPQVTPLTVISNQNYVKDKHYGFLERNLEHLFTWYLVTDINQADYYRYYHDNIGFNLQFNRNYSHQFRTIYDLVNVFAYNPSRDIDYHGFAEYIGFSNNELCLFIRTFHRNYDFSIIDKNQNKINSRIMVVLIIYLCHLENDLFTNIKCTKDYVSISDLGTRSTTRGYMQYYEYDNVLASCKKTPIPIEFLLRLQSILSKLIPKCEMRDNKLNQAIEENKSELQKVNSLIDLTETKQRECLEALKKMNMLDNKHTNSYIIEYRKHNDEYNKIISTLESLYNTKNTIGQMLKSNDKMKSVYIPLDDIKSFEKMVSTTIMLNIPIVEVSSAEECLPEYELPLAESKV